ncbi:MAG: 50S ribosome-binding GTPase, partial [Candidatus Diapherotrites archaeon]|nr:50S ribosome-binding GTPase [Candidatus Diapherotrites archaeon]
AFRKARKEAGKLRKQHNKLRDSKAKAIKKTEVACDYFAEVLLGVTRAFPNMQQISLFYKELIEATVDINPTLHALSQMNSAAAIVEALKRQYIGKIKGVRKDEEKKAEELVSSCYGRLASIAKSLSKSIEEYNKSAAKMRELPDVDFETPTVIIAGYPNTGKSTLLGRLTKSKPKIAAYPFTTQKLQIGYLIHNYRSLRLIDTPGLLDRPLEKRNKIERKAIAALRYLAKAVVFVVDPTTYCGFELEKQLNLFNEIKKELLQIPLIVVLNKADLASAEEMEAAKKAFGGDAFVEGEGIESGLREKMTEFAGNAAG